MFTSVHAFQYGFDVLIQVLILGFILGYIRKASNTTTSAIVHSGYDFCVFITAYFMGR
jgi:membrane protease YdiL (CAAX protease family)